MGDASTHYMANDFKIIWREPLNKILFYIAAYRQNVGFKNYGRKPNFSAALEHLKDTKNNG